MALTQISTAGVKDDAVTAGKIPANAVGSSELADNAVDTAAIADDAVNGDKIAADAVSTSHIADNSILAAQMGDDAIGIAELSASGTASSSTFLRGDNSWTAVNTDLVADTSPQLGGNLDTNNHDVTFQGLNNYDLVWDYSEADLTFSDSAKLRLGTGNDLSLYHDGTDNFITAANGHLNIYGDGTNEIYIRGLYNEDSIIIVPNGTVKLFHDNSQKLETTSWGTQIYGALATTGNIDCATDSYKIKAGAGGDLELFHDGSETYVKNANASSNLILESAHGVHVKHGGENMAKFIQDGAVELYHDNVKRIATNSSSYKGAIIHGDATNTSIAMQTESTARGYFYANNSDQIGLLDAGGDWAIKHANDAYTEFRVGTAVKATVNTHGITFNGDTAAANALDDYEQGSWSPSTYGNWYNIGTFRNTIYTKVGRLVTVHFDLFQTNNNMGWDANVSVRGFPYEAESSLLSSGSCNTFSYTSGDAKWIPNYVDAYTNAQLVLHSHAQSQNIRHLLFNFTYMAV